MDVDGGDNGIDNTGYFDDEYKDIQWADNVDETELTGTDGNDSAVLERHGEHADAINVEVVTEGEADGWDSVSHHAIGNTQEHDQEVKSVSTISNPSNDATNGESSNGATFFNIQLVDSVKHVKKKCDNEIVTSSEINSKQRNGLSSSNTNETETVKNGASLDVLQMDRMKTGWLARLYTDVVFRRNICESIGLLFVVVTMGWIYALMGPSLPDLQIISGMGLQEASWLFTGYAVGYMIGCATSGLLLIRLSVRALLALSCITAGVAAEILPLIPNGYVMVAMRAVGGAALGAQDTALTVRLFEIWGSDGGPWFQLTHCLFSVGGIMSPLMLKPFLAQRLASSARVNITNETGLDVTQTEYENSDNSVTNNPQLSTLSTMDWVNSTVDQMLSFTTESAVTPVIGKSNIHYAYLISAILSILASVPFVIYYLKYRQQVKNASDGDKDMKVNTLPRKWKYSLLTIMCMIAFIGTGYIDAFPNYLTSFGILQMGDTKEDCSFATSIYFAMNAVGNFVGVFMLSYFSPGKFIAILHTVTSVAFTLYYISIRLHLTQPLQWTCIAMSGVGISALLPTMYTWTQYNVTPVSGRVASAYLVSGSLGIMITPMFLGYLMENVTPMWFMYTMFVYEGVCIVLFVAATITVMYCGREKVSTRSTASENNIQINPAFQTDVNVEEVGIDPQ